MKKLFLIDIKKKAVKSYLKDYNLSLTKDIHEADMALANVQIKNEYHFEIDPMTTILIAQAQSLNLPIVTFNFDLSIAEEKIKTSSLTVKNGLCIKENTFKFINKKHFNLGDFLYENAYGNGMIFLNHNILNIYDKDPKLALEVLLNLYLASKFEKPFLIEFYSLSELNEYIKDTYPCPAFFTPKPIAFYKKEKVNKELFEDKVYLMGDDVFYISPFKDKLVKHMLLEYRAKVAGKHNLDCLAPYEMDNSMTIDKVIKGNNDLAKYSSYFQANLHSMPLEDYAVDTGTLYEIALNVFSGGKGIVHIDKSMKTFNKELYNWLNKNKSIKLVSEIKEEKIFKKLAKHIKN